MLSTRKKENIKTKKSPTLSEGRKKGAIVRIGETIKNWEGACDLSVENSRERRVVRRRTNI